MKEQRVTFVVMTVIVCTAVFVVTLITRRQALAGASVGTHEERSSAAGSAEGYVIQRDKDVAQNEPGPHKGGGPSTGYIFFENLPDLKFSFPSLYTIAGDLRDDGGQLFSGATVCALQTNDKVVNVRDRVCAESDAQGKFVINLASSGRYQVVAEKMSEGYMPPYFPFYKDPKTPIPEVMVSGENPNAFVSVKLGPKSGLISGKVIDEATDLPVQDFVVWTWQARDLNARTHQVVKGSPSGRFRILAPPVSFRMRVVSEGYEDWVMGGGVLVSLAGARKGPGALLVRTGGNAEFAVYLRRKNPSPIDQTKAGDEKRLPAPIQLAPQDNQVFDVFPRNTKLEWNPVAGAVSYAVEVESCWNRSQEERSRLPDDGECINPSPYEDKFGLHETTYEFFFKGAQPGRWRVWAIDKDRRQGIKSPWRRFTYLK